LTSYCSRVLGFLGFFGFLRFLGFGVSWFYGSWILFFGRGCKLFFVFAFAFLLALRFSGRKVLPFGRRGFVRFSAVRFWGGSAGFIILGLRVLRYPKVC